MHVSSADKLCATQAEANTTQSAIRAELPACEAVPFLKWAGGKRAIASQILPFLGSPEGHYFEPFLGGGAIFFALGPSVAILSDVNGELIECYEVVKEQPKALADRLSTMKNSEDAYYEIRGEKPRSKLGRAARFLYLTTLSFNGIYRQNLRGEFNVPYGKKTQKTLPSFEELELASTALSKVQLLSDDFEASTEQAGAGDTIYFDPPYTVAHNNNGFVKYNAAIFSWKDQVRLAQHAKKLVRRGCRVIVSNADHHSVRALYGGFATHILRRHSVIAANREYRREVTECLFVSEP